MTASRWVPATEAELLDAAESGLLAEGHHFEIKREVGAAKGERKETARDLASFAIDGGTLIVGIAEDKQKQQWTPEPAPLAGLAERVEQIAANLIDPPLSLRVRDLPAEAQSGSGYLVVEVAASPEAPHMVDGVYYGRGEKTRIRLGDAEVRRLHASRADQDTRMHRLIAEELARDPVDETDRLGGHLYLVAQPVNASSSAAHSVVWGDADFLWQLVDSGDSAVPRSIRSLVPYAASANQFVHRSNGVARCTESLQHGRAFSNGDPKAARLAADIEFRVDGGIRAFCAGMTVLNARPEVNAHQISDRLALAWTLRMVHWARLFADAYGYRGSWQFGVAATGLRGLVSSWNSSWNPAVYDRDDFQSQVTAGFFDLSDQPNSVADRLIGQLCRALGTYDLAERSLK